nr:MAG TPA: hypothetical protein [Caudoviricetes sp.]
MNSINLYIINKFILWVTWGTFIKTMALLLG